MKGLKKERTYRKEDKGEELSVQIEKISITKIPIRLGIQEKIQKWKKERRSQDQDLKKKIHIIMSPDKSSDRKK